MNLLKIAMKDLKEFIVQKKIIFIILIISLIVSSYGFLFFTSLNMNIAQIMNSYKGISNSFFISKNSFTQKEIQETIEYIKKMNIDITYHIFSNVQVGEKVQYTNISEKNSKRQLYNLIIGSNKTNKATEEFVGRLMNQEDRNDCSNYIMIEDSSNRALNDMFILNKEITINNKKYVVRALDQININIFKYLEYINYDNISVMDVNDIEIGIIPDTTFYKENYKILGLEIVIPTNISNENKIEIIKFLQNKFDNNTLILPQYTSNSLWNINFYTILYIILMIMALVNIMALFTYWIDKNWRKYMIYRLNGATNRTIYNLIMLECFIISSVAFIISLIIYFSTILLLRALEINYILKMNEIIILYLIIILIVSFNVHVIAKKISKTEVRYLGRK